MKRCRHLSTLSCGLLLWLWATVAVAAPQLISFQAMLQANNAPLNGAYDLTFSVYATLDGGPALWSETQFGVPVEKGIYSVQLGSAVPFPADLFAAEPRFLEVEVGGETMSPRLEITSTSYSLNADTVDGKHAVALQNRVTGSCAAGSSIRVINANGTVGCETDDAGITSESDPQVGANSTNYVPKWNGSELVSGVLYDSGTTIGIGITTPAAPLHISTGADVASVFESTDVTSALEITDPNGTAAVRTSGGHMIFGVGGYELAYEKARITADGNVGIGTTNPTEKLTVAGIIESTSGGLKFPDGTVQSTAIEMPLAHNPRANSLTTVDSGGFSISITIGPDGLPVISYYDDTNGDLKVAKCGNASCSSGNTITTVDSEGDVGVYTSITIGTDGLPVIAYYDSTNADLKVAKCGNASCSAGNTITTVDFSATESIGLFPSIIIGMDGRPVISYKNWISFDTETLKVAKCGNASCSSGNTITTMDTGHWIDSSIAIGTDGRPVIVYTNTNAVKVARCGNASCSAANVITTVSIAAVSSPSFPSLTIGTDGLPIFIVVDTSDFSLVGVKCGDASCSSVDNNFTVGASVDEALIASMTIGADGMPVIAYWGSTNEDLIVAKCGDASCSGNITRATVNATGSVGDFPSITIGTDGLPVIAYQDSTNSTLKVAKCANQFCLNNWSRR